MVESKLKSLSLVGLYNYPPVNSVSKFSRIVSELGVADLVQKYKSLLEKAPRRHERGKKYFVGHDVFSGGKVNSNRKEEHLAGALFNECRKGKRFLLPDKRKLQIIDYQFPLKARQSDKGVGKVDLMGVINDQTPCVIELKVDQKGGGKADTPLRALLEGLAYCAIVEANKKEIWKEAQGNLGITFKGPRPHLMILGTANYWSYYLNQPSAGSWRPALNKLIADFKAAPLPSASLISLGRANFNYATGNRPACLTQKLAFLSVSQ